GLPEDDSLTPLGDAVLRQELANPDKGAAMVARGVLAVDSIADLLALSAEQRREDLRYLVKGYHAGSDMGGGEFYWDADRTKAEANGGTVIDPDNIGLFDGSPNTLDSFFSEQGTGSGSGCWVRKFYGAPIPVECFGAVGDNEGINETGTDDTKAIQQALDFCDNLVF